jgi:hypothetical protein
LLKSAKTLHFAAPPKRRCSVAIAANLLCEESGAVVNCAGFKEVIGER